jgi:hypothetical protein
MGRFLIIVGFITVALGLLIHFQIEVPWISHWIGRLPGDIVIKKEGVFLYFPLASSAVLSLILSFILYLFGVKK